MTGRILVTGASGFVGQALVAALAADGRPVRAATRYPERVRTAGVETVQVPDLVGPMDWRSVLDNVEAVVHAAGIAHARRGATDETYDRVNRAAAAALAAAAAAAGVRRFVFLSSVRAQSGASAPGVLRETDVAQPTNPYGRSKLAAEHAIAAAGVPYVHLRPVVVYGPGVRGNFAFLLKLAALPCPLPFGAFETRRSLLGLDNLIAAIQLALDSPTMVSETYLVADPKPLTLAEILMALREGYGRPARLFQLPPALLRLALTAIGRTDLWERIAGPLIVDPAKLLAAGWQPPLETRAGLTAIARGTRQPAR